MRQRCYQVQSSRGTCFTGGGRIIRTPSQPTIPAPNPYVPLEPEPAEPLNVIRPDLRPSEGDEPPVKFDLAKLPSFIKSPATSKFGSVNPGAALEDKQEDAKEQAIDEWPADHEKEVITFFSHADWSKHPDEVQLVECLRSEEFRDFKETRLFKHITNTDTLYKERFQGHVPEAIFPALMVQWPDGATYFTVTRANVPGNGEDLVKAIKIGRSLDPRVSENHEDQGFGLLDAEQRIDQELDFQPYADDLSPFKVEPNIDELAEMRIRDAFGRLIFMGGLIFCIGVMLVILPIALIIFYIIRPRD